MAAVTVRQLRLDSGKSTRAEVRSRTLRNRTQTVSNCHPNRTQGSETVVVRRAAADDPHDRGGPRTSADRADPAATADAKALDRPHGPGRGSAADPRRFRRGRGAVCKRTETDAHRTLGGPSGSELLHAQRLIDGCDRTPTPIVPRQKRPEARHDD